jgi:pyrophosphatase PpaX
MKKTYETYLFDWDGTLGESLGVWLNAYKKVFAQYEIYPTDLDITKKVFGDWKGPVKLGVPEEELETYNQQLLRLVNDGMIHVELSPHVTEVLQKLHQGGAKLSIITTSRRATLESCKSFQQVRHYFNPIITQDDVVHGKPDPEIIFKALHELKAAIETAVIVGDTKKDIQAGNNAGIDSILFFPPFHQPYYDEAEIFSYNPTRVIADFSELIEE